MIGNLGNALLFQLGWFTAVLGGDSRWLLVVAAILALHLLWAPHWREEARLLIRVLLLGTLVDTLLRQAGILAFKEPAVLIPLWLMLLWLLLATTLRHCLAWTARPWWRASLLGALAGPLAYYTGAQLAGVTFPRGLWSAMGVIGLLWAALLPLLHHLAQAQPVRANT